MIEARTTNSARWGHRGNSSLVLLIPCVLVLLGGCGEEVFTYSTPDTNSITAAPEEVPIPLEPTYLSIKANIFEKRCMGCHSDAGTGHDVPLNPKEKLMSSPRELVIPGNSEESGLTIAVTRTDDKRMPPKGDPLTQEQITAIKKWIDDCDKQ
jgi:uncharacterized membrane protein